MNRNKLMEKIAKEGHSFPHYWSCNTCIEDFETVAKFGASEARQQAIAEIDLLKRKIVNSWSWDEKTKALVAELKRIKKRLGGKDVKHNKR